jgi:hypothetical protein
MVCARSLFLFAVIETAPPEEGVWYGGPEQPKVNGVVGEGGGGWFGAEPLGGLERRHPCKSTLS